jgi:small neutral amino acid transporter SnatA (MarC family)
MELPVLLLAMLAAVNPPRVRSALPDDDRAMIAWLASLVSGAVLVAIAALAGPFTAWLDLMASTVRMAAGATLVIQGIVTFVSAPPRPEPRLPGRLAAVVPVAFPVTLTPGLALLTLSGALDRSAPTAVALAAVGLCIAAASGGVHLGPSPESTRRRTLAGVARLLAVLMVFCGMALLADGIFDL